MRVLEAARREADERSALAALADRRRRYHDAWAALAGEARIGLAHVPWPCRAAPAPLAARPPELAEGDVAELVLDAGMDPPACRRTLQGEQRRWHPDKLGARYGRRLREEERGAILEGVKQVSQILNALLKSRGT